MNDLVDRTAGSRCIHNLYFTCTDCNSELSRLRVQLDYYDGNVKARREMGDLSSLACLYCEYVEGTLKKQCSTHAALARLRAERDSLAAENRGSLVERTAQIAAHRGCCGAEHDPLNGKLHGNCVVCGVPWPCDYAGMPPPHTAREVERVKALEAVAVAVEHLTHPDGVIRGPLTDGPELDGLNSALAALTNFPRTVTSNHGLVCPA